MTPFDLDWQFQVMYWIGCITTGMKLGDILFWIFKLTRR